jgi:site-specific DNA-methyltransferase (adenine-specific)
MDLTDHKDENLWLMKGDCLDRMREIPDGSVDMVLCDLPYGTTACKWDTVIPFEPLWREYRRVTKPNAAIVLTASQPFTTSLIASNFDEFKYSLIWKKNNATGFMQAKTKPLNSHEDILVFGEFKVAAQYFNGTYNPQGVKDSGLREYRNERKEDHITGNRVSGIAQSGKGYPKSVLEFDNETKTVHPTQKPVALMEYLIRTYTNEGETVLDNTMGSGTTGFACVNTRRKFIGIEMNDTYFDIAKTRILESSTPKLLETFYEG